MQCPTSGARADLQCVKGTEIAEGGRAWGRTATIRADVVPLAVTGRSPVTLRGLHGWCRWLGVMEMHTLPLHPQRRPMAIAGPPLRSDTTSAVSLVRRDTEADTTAGSDRAAAVPWQPPGTLDLSVRRRGALIELGLAGDLDMATAPRLGEAMAWLRFSRGPAPTILVDTTDLDFIAAAGYHALQAVLVRPDGLWDPRVVLVIGPALARFEAAISASSTPGGRLNPKCRLPG
jgi:hypothetical protein